MMKKCVLFMALFLAAVGGLAQQGDNHGVELPEADELHITATDEALPDGAAGSYMRVVLDREIKAGGWTLIIVPAALDGYYFGADAERYKVAKCDLTTTPVSLVRESMDDLDDFAPNEMYLVRSASDMEQIVSLVPGLPTDVPEASGVTLMCLTLSDFQDASSGIAEERIDSNKSGRIYDLTGRVSKSVARGIYIINGKKVFVR